MFNVDKFVSECSIPETKEDLEKFANILLSKYKESLAQAVIDGRSVTIEGLGVLKPSYRRVKNPMGREFSIKAKIDNSPEFSRKLLESFNKDPDKFGVNL